MSTPDAQMVHPPPLVSIGLPVYNGEKLLAQSLDSILGQTFTDFELIISDNCSTDATQAISRDYASRDSRIRYVRNTKNIGARPNFNQIVGMARGRFFKWAAHDDLLAPDYLEKCIAVLETDPSVALCHSLSRLIDDDGEQLPLPPPDQFYIVDKHGEVIFAGNDAVGDSLASSRPDWRFRAIMMDSCWVYEIFGVMRTDVLRRTPLMEAYYGADKLLLAQIALHGRIINVQEYLFFSRRHPQQSRSIPTIQGRDQWMDPNVSHSLYMHNWRLFRGMVSAIGTHGLSLGARLGLAVVVTRYYIRPMRIWANLKHYHRPEQAQTPEPAMSRATVSGGSQQSR